MILRDSAGFNSRYVLFFVMVSYQMQLVGTGSQFVGPQSRFYVLERQGTPLTHVQQIAEFFIFPYLKWCLSVQDVRWHAILDVYRGFEGFSPQSVR